jgi:hypothetical protein
VADLGGVLGAQLLRDPMHLGIGPELLGGPGVQLHGRSPTEDRRQSRAGGV